MSLARNQQAQKDKLEQQIEKSLRLQGDAEGLRDLASSPLERERLDDEASRHKAVFERYRQELAELEAEIRNPSSSSARTLPALNPPFRVTLDESLSAREQEEQFRTEVADIVEILDYEIESASVAGAASDDFPMFVAVQDGDFESLRSLFGTTCGLIDEREVSKFRAVYEQNRSSRGLRSGILVTNTYVTPSARQLAAQSQIQVLVFAELIDRVFKFSPYLRTKCQDYEEQGALVRTYVDVKYMRRGRGSYPDERATPEETLVTSTSVVATAGGAELPASFEAKGELTPYINAWVRTDGGGQICLLGDYGTGKTSFATHYFWQAAKVYMRDPIRNRIPLLVPLNKYHTATDVEQMMTAFLVNECGTRRDFRTFLRLAERGKFLVILDGFDEMAKQVDHNVRRRNFRELARLVVGRNKVILSGRPNYFLTHAEIEELFTSGAANADPYRRALRSAIKASPQYDLLTLTLFDRWQIEEFLKKQSDYLKTRGIDDWRDLQRTIYRTYNLEELARTPVLLEIIIKTLSELRTQVSEINAAKLYELYTDHWLDREYDEKGDVRWLITRQDKELFVLELAWSMLTGEGRPEIHFSLLSERVKDHFELENATQIEYLSSDIRFCSYLVHSKTDGTYRFVHKSFMEYFCARYLLQNLFHAGFREEHVARVATSKVLPEEVFFFLCQSAGDDGVVTLFEQAREHVHKTFLVQLGMRMLQHFIAGDRRRGANEEAQRRIDVLIGYCQEFEDQAGHLWALAEKGEVLASSGRLVEAEARYRNALFVAQQLGDQDRMGRLILQLGILDRMRAKTDAALERFQSLLATFDYTDRPRLRFEVLREIGIVYQMTGDLAGARQKFDQASVLAHTMDDRDSMASALELTADVCRQMGEHVEALDYLRRSLALHREAADRRAEGLTLIAIADISESTGRLRDATASFVDALLVFEELNSQSDVSRVLVRLARLNVATNIKLAEHQVRHALELSEELNELPHVASALSLLAEVLSETAQYEEALVCQTRALGIWQQLDVPVHGVTGLAALAETSLALNRVDEARAFSEQALSMLTRLTDDRGKVLATRRLGALALRQDEPERARAFFERALDAARHLSDATVETEIIEELADTASAAGEVAQAEGLYQAAMESFERIGNRLGGFNISLKMARMAHARRNLGLFARRYSRYREFAQEERIPLDDHLEAEYARIARTGAVSDFDISRPAVDPEDFWGRQKELECISHLLEQLRPVAVVGESRSGKTSVLLQLVRRLVSPIVPVYVNLNKFPLQTESLLEGILHEVLEVLEGHGLLSGSSRQRASVTYGADFGRALVSIKEEATKALPGCQLLLMLDDADAVVRVGGAAVMALEAAVRPGISTVLAINDRLADEARLRRRMLNDFALVPLGPLSEDDLMGAVRATMKSAGLAIEPDALQQIYRWSGGMPWSTRLIGHEAVNGAFRKQKTAILPDDLESIRQTVAERAAPIFESNFTRLDRIERRILMDLAGIEVGSPDPSTFSRHRGISHSLVMRGIVVKSDRDEYDIASTLYTDWIRVHARSSGVD